ncbi:MAG: hypothetical protein J5890_02640 [Clostridia bacterium]|nr:hypothetical protein [Clostridia bacterium]
MKKFFALIIAVAMVLSLVAIPASASEESVVFTVGSVSDVNPGDEVVIPISVSGHYEAHTVKIKLFFDPENVEYVGLEKNPELNSYFTYEELSANADFLGIAILGLTDPFSVEGVLYNVTLKVKESCTEDQPVTLEVGDFFYSPIGQGHTSIPFSVNPDGMISLHVDPTEPPVEPTEPVVEPTEPVVEPTEPVVEPTEPVVEPTEPVVEPTEPVVEPTEPVVEPTEPVVEPTEPVVEPTEPVVEPTEPAPHAVFTMESAENVLPGSEITLAFTIEGEYEASTLYAQLNYDASVLQVVGFTQGDVLDAHEDAIIVTDYETIPGSVRLGVILPTGSMTENGTLLNVTFKVSEDFTEPTDIVVNINEFNFVPETTEIPVEFVTVDGVVSPFVNGPATITMGSAYEVPGGSEITLPLTVEGNYMIHTLNIFVDYDVDVLTIENVELGSMIAPSRDGSDPVVVLDYETVPGSIRLGVIMPDEALTGEGELLNVTFKVADEFNAPTDLPVTVNEFGYMPVGAINQEPIDVVVVDGIVTPVEVVEPTEPVVEPTEPVVEPTEPVVETTEEPVEPTEAPVEPTEAPVEPTVAPTNAPTPKPPVTGAISLAGLGIAAIAAGAGIVIFRKKED